MANFSLSKITGFLQGRHTAFASAFFLLGNVMHWFHRLDATYITFMGTLMGFVLGHSVKESIVDRPQDPIPQPTPAPPPMMPPPPAA